MRKDEIFRIRCTTTDREQIAELATRLRVSQSEAIRAAIKAAAETNLKPQETCSKSEAPAR